MDPDQQQPPAAADTTPPAGGQNSGVPSAPPAPEPQEIVHQIPQSDLDSRIKRAEAHAVTDLLKVLGVENADTLKTLVAAEKARRDGEKTDLQKAQDTVATLTQERDTFKAEYEKLLNEVKADRTLATIRDEAAGAKHPEDILTWARENAAEELAAIMGDNHQPDKAKAKALVTKCQKARPDWFTPETPGSPSNAGGKGPASLQQAQKLAEQTLRQVKSYL